jgi:hypothetical protein
LRKKSHDFVVQTRSLFELLLTLRCSRQGRVADPCCRQQQQQPATNDQPVKKFRHENLSSTKTLMLHDPIRDLPFNMTSGQQSFQSFEGQYSGEIANSYSLFSRFRFKSENPGKKYQGPALSCARREITDRVIPLKSLSLTTPKRKPSYETHHLHFAGPRRPVFDNFCHHGRELP